MCKWNWKIHIWYGYWLWSWFDEYTVACLSLGFFFISDKLSQGEGSVSSVVGGESGANNSNKDTGKININHQKVKKTKQKTVQNANVWNTCINICVF